MDKVAQPIQGSTITSPALTDKCRLMEEFFQKEKISRLEFDIPGIGCYSNANMVLAHVKSWSSALDRLIWPMKVCWSWGRVGNANLFVRELSQEITKPVNIRLPMNKKTGFNYKIKTKENVVISRLLVDINDIEDSISQLICEANRFYILYCFPAS